MNNTTKGVEKDESDEESRLEALCGENQMPMPRDSAGKGGGRGQDEGEAMMIRGGEEIKTR